MLGVRRKQTECLDEVNPKRNRADEPICKLGIFHIPKSNSLQLILFQNLSAFSHMVVFPTSKFTASLSWLVHPAKFYVQASCMMDGLDKMMGMIESLCPDNIPPMRAVEQGQPCLAKFEGAWYRGQVNSKQMLSFRVIILKTLKNRS